MIKKNFFFNLIYLCNPLVALFFLSIVISFIPAYAETHSSEEVPLLETTQLELLGTKHGKLSLNIKASKMCQYASGNITLTGGIEISILTNEADEEGAFTYIKANKLSYNKEQGLCMIAGNVLVTKPQEQLKINTEQLCYDMKQEIIFTEVPVVITHKKHLLQGGLLRATRDLTKYTVTSPSGTVDVKQEAALGADLL